MRPFVRHPSRYRAIIAACLAVTAAGASAAPLEITTRMLVAKRVAAADGTTRIDLVTPGKVVPGDQVTFVLRYRNTGRQPIANVVLANPLPRGVAFRGAGAGTPPPEVSTDGSHYAPLAALRVAAPGGGARAATPDDVVAVRWRLTTPVAAGAAGQFAFQGVLR